MKFPKDIQYTKDHEWAKVDGKVVTVGITDHAQSSLGDVVLVELPKIGRTIRAGETFGVVESVKAVSDLYSPIEGKIIEVNDALNANPGIVNSDPYNEAWLIKIETTLPPKDLMDADAYKSYVENL